MSEFEMARAGVMPFAVLESFKCLGMENVYVDLNFRSHVQCMGCPQVTIELHTCASPSPSQSGIQMLMKKSLEMRSTFYLRMRRFIEFKFRVGFNFKKLRGQGAQVSIQLVYVYLSLAGLQVRLGLLRFKLLESIHG